MKISILVLSSVLALSASAFAGDVLKLQAGTVRLQDASSSIFSRVLRESSQGSEIGGRKAFVVQFDGRITESLKAELASRGLAIGRYLPDDALIVRGDARAAALLKGGVQGVRAVSPMLAEWKISPEFFSVASEGGAKTERLIVATADEAAVQETLLELRKMSDVGVKLVDGIDIVVDAPAARVSDIARIEGTEWVERMPIIVSFDMPMDEQIQDDPTPPAFTGYESGTKVMNFDAAYSRGFYGAGQVVAVADTGCDTGDLSTIHQDFGQVLKGYPIGLGTENWADTMGHGTHVSGSIVGTGKASNGQIHGGAYKASLIMEGLWSPILDNLAPGTDFNKIIGTVYKDGARVHSNSWGSPANPGAYDSMAMRVDEYMFNNPEMLVLFAAGNEGQDADRDGRIDENSIGSPATAKNVLTVGASENLFTDGGIQKPLAKLRNGDKKWGVEPLASDTLSNNPNGIAAFSSRGPTADGRIKPEIVAPGTNIVSLMSTMPGAEKLWGPYSKDYVYSGGTSMATPLAAGAAAVTREYLVKARNIAAPSAALVKATMMHTAKDLYPGQFGEGPKQELPTRRPNVHEGYGRVDMDAATNLGNTQLIDDKSGVGVGEEKTISVTVKQGQSIRATMSYTDAPASTSAAKALVNDIDLSVTTPAGAVSTKDDHVNNTEMLELSGLDAGTYKVSVRGVNVPQGKNGRQPYALVVTAF